MFVSRTSRVPVVVWGSLGYIEGSLAASVGLSISRAPGSIMSVVR